MIYPFPGVSHDAAEHLEGDEGVDLEYGWALAKDTSNSMEEGLSEMEAIERIIDTSYDILKPGGYTVYNLESVGSRPEYNGQGHFREIQDEFSEKLEDIIIRKDYGEKIGFYRNPDFYTNSPHFVWQKQ